MVLGKMFAPYEGKVPLKNTTSAELPRRPWDVAEVLRLRSFVVLYPFDQVFEFLLIVRYRDSHSFHCAVLETIGTLNHNRVHAPAAALSGTLRPQVHRQISSDLPVWCRVAVADTIDWLVAADPADTARPRRMTGI